MAEPTPKELQDLVDQIKQNRKDEKDASQKIDEARKLFEKAQKMAEEAYGVGRASAKKNADVLSKILLDLHMWKDDDFDVGLLKKYKDEHVVTMQKLDMNTRKLVDEVSTVTAAEYLESRAVCDAYRKLLELKKTGKKDVRLETALSMVVFGTEKWPDKPDASTTPADKAIYEAGLGRLYSCFEIGGGKLQIEIPGKASPGAAAPKGPAVAPKTTGDGGSGRQSMANPKDAERDLDALAMMQDKKPQESTLPDSVMAALDKDFKLPDGVALAEPSATGGKAPLKPREMGPAGVKNLVA